jgi:hypothetical protein
MLGWWLDGYQHPTPRVSRQDSDPRLAALDKHFMPELDGARAGEIPGDSKGRSSGGGGWGSAVEGIWSKRPELGTDGEEQGHFGPHSWTVPFLSCGTCNCTEDACYGQRSTGTLRLFCRSPANAALSARGGLAKIAMIQSATTLTYAPAFSGHSASVVGNRQEYERTGPHTICQGGDATVINAGVEEHYVHAGRMDPEVFRDWIPTPNPVRNRDATPTPGTSVAPPPLLKATPGKPFDAEVFADQVDMPGNNEASPVKRWIAAERWGKVTPCFPCACRNVSVCILPVTPFPPLCWALGKRVSMITYNRCRILSFRKSPPSKASGGNLLAVRFLLRLAHTPSLSHAFACQHVRNNPPNLNNKDGLLTVPSSWSGGSVHVEWSSVMSPKKVSNRDKVKFPSNLSSSYSASDSSTYSSKSSADSSSYPSLAGYAQCSSLLQERAV